MVDWECRTCTHSIEHGEHHLFCNVHGIVSVYPCGRWERGAGCHTPENAPLQGKAISRDGCLDIASARARHEVRRRNRSSTN